MVLLLLDQRQDLSNYLSGRASEVHAENDDAAAGLLQRGPTVSSSLGFIPFRLAPHIHVQGSNFPQEDPSSVDERDLSRDVS